MNRIYLDHAATTPVDPRVRQAMEPYFEYTFGNPSSIHGFGQDALVAVENARKEVAKLLVADPQEIVFTSGGTESDNAAILSACRTFREKGNHIVTTAIEHHAVLHTCRFMKEQGFDVSVVPVSTEGIVDPDDIRKALTKKTILVSVMHANNEIGTIQPLREIGAIARTNSVCFHTDAVQTFGHIPVGADDLHLDFLSLSGHKLYGPKGIGALYIRKGTPFSPLIHGGGQEKNRRSSTHNVPGIVGLGKAAELARTEMTEENQRIKALRNRLHETIGRNTEGVRLNGHAVLRLANNLNLSIDRVDGESLLMRLDMEGIAVSSGSACGSASGEPSHVLLALGLSPEQARGSIRITLGRPTTEAEVDRIADVLKKTVGELRSLAS